MNQLQTFCSLYLSFLRAIYLNHQNNHWLAKGSNFYSNHLMFERLYKSAQDNADVAAEKFLTLFGDECITDQSHTQNIVKILNNSKDDDILASSLKLEKDFLTFSKNFYNFLKSKHTDKLSLGLDDMIMSIASDSEESCYLLSRSLNKNEKSANMSSKLIKVAEKFEKKLAQIANSQTSDQQLVDSELAMRVSSIVESALGPEGKNMITFTELRKVGTPEKLRVKYKVNVTPALAAKFKSINKDPMKYADEVIKGLGFAIEFKVRELSPSELG